MTSNEIKSILSFLEIEGFTGDFSVRKTTTRKGFEIHLVETEKASYEAVTVNNETFLKATDSWVSTKTGSAVADVEGLPIFIEKSTLSAKELSEITGKALCTIYYHLKKNGRMPTVEELTSARAGRPRKY